MRNWINIWRFEAWLNPAVFHLRHKHCHHLIKNSNGINDAPFLSGTKIDGLHKWYECQLLEESNIEFNSFSVLWLLAIISRHTQHKDRDSIDGGTRIRSDIIINEEHISFFLSLSYPLSGLSFVVRSFGLWGNTKWRSLSYASSMFISATINVYVIFPTGAQGWNCFQFGRYLKIRRQCNTTSVTPRRASCTQIPNDLFILFAG